MALDYLRTRPRARRDGLAQCSLNGEIGAQAELTGALHYLAFSARLNRNRVPESFGLTCFDHARRCALSDAGAAPRRPRNDCRRPCQTVRALAPAIKAPDRFCDSVGAVATGPAAAYRMEFA